METHGATLEHATTGELLARIVHTDDAAAAAGFTGPLSELARPGLNGAAALIGFGDDTRDRIAAAFELGRRRALEMMPARTRVSGARDVVRVLEPGLRDAPVEVFRVVLLDARHAVLATPEIARGTLSSSLVHPREVLRPALIAAAAAVIIAHNHPSGDPSPSAEDDTVTRRLARAGQLLGVPLLDHVVIGDGAWFSYRDHGHAALTTRADGSADLQRL